MENSFVNSLKINQSGMGTIVLKGEKIRNLDLIIKGAEMFSHKIFQLSESEFNTTVIRMFN